MAIQCVRMHKYHEGIAVLQGQIEQVLVALVDDHPPVPSCITQHLDFSSVFWCGAVLIVALHNHRYHYGVCVSPVMKTGM